MAQNDSILIVNTKLFLLFELNIPIQKRILNLNFRTPIPGLTVKKIFMPNNLIVGPGICRNSLGHN